MSSEKVAPSNLEYLIKHGALPQGTTLEDAIYILTDPLNCAECIAEDQCADRYIHDAGKNKEADCLEAVAAFLQQDHKEVKRKT